MKEMSFVLEFIFLSCVSVQCFSVHSSFVHFVCLGIPCLLVSVSTLSCHRGFNQWFTLEKQVLFSQSFPILDLHSMLNLDAKTHVRYVCVCNRKVLNIFYIILQTLHSPFTIPSSISVLFSWCRRDWHRSKWGFWWKQVSLQSFTKCVLLKVLCVAF